MPSKQVNARRSNRRAWLFAIAFLLVLTGLAALVWWSPDPQPARSREQPAVATSPPSKPAAVSDHASSGASLGREHVELGAPAWLTEGFDFTVEFETQVRNAAEKMLFLGLDGSSTNLVRVGTDPDGVAKVSFRGKQRDVCLIVDQGVLRRVHLVAGKTHRVTLGTRLEVRYPAGNEDEPPSAPSDPDPKVATLRGDDAFAQFGEGKEVGDASPFLWESFLGLGGAGLTPAMRPRLGAIAGVVVDELGNSVDGATVSLSSGGCDATAHTRGGRFRFGELLPGRYALAVSHAQIGLAKDAIQVGIGDTDVRLVLAAGPAVRGSVRAPDGSPLRARRIVWQGHGGEWRDEVCTGDDGSFLLPNLSAVRGSLWVLDAEHHACIPAVGAAVVRDGPEVLLTLDPTQQNGRLRVDVAGVGTSPVDVAVRVWHVASGLGVHAMQVPDTSAFELGGLGAGFYDVEVVVPGLGVVGAGRHWVDGQSLSDVGRMVAPAPGHLVIDADADALPADEQRAFTIYHLRADANLFVVPQQPPPALALLGAGDYALGWRDADLQTRFARFAIRGGETTVVSLRR